MKDNKIAKIETKIEKKHQEKQSQIDNLKKEIIVKMALRLDSKEHQEILKMR